MNAKELTNNLISKGLILEEHREFTETAIQEAMNECGEEAVTEGLMKTRNPINYPTRYIAAVAKSIREKQIHQQSVKAKEAKVDDLEERKQPRQQDEIDIEAEDLRQWDSHMRLMREMFPDDPEIGFTKGNSPRFFEEPCNIFNAEPYASAPEELRVLYRENTFIEVYRQSCEEGVTMHEICRRKGLKYEWLII